MSQVIDNLITFRILHILLQPIEKSDAYLLGIIDKNGKQIKKPQTEDEKDSYTNLTKLAFKVKNLLKKNPQSEKDLHALATSVHLVKEFYNSEDINIDKVWFDEISNSITEADLKIVQNLMINEGTYYSFETFVEDAPPNNASATPGVDGFTPDTTGAKKSKVQRRKIKKFNTF